jgi:sulfonate transport system permease protein
MNALNPAAFEAALAPPPVAARRLDRWAGRALPLLVPLALLLLWLLNAREGWLPAQVLPTPQSVVVALRDSLAWGELQTNLGMTLLWLLEGFAIAAVLGTALGIAMGLSQKVSDYLYPSFKAIAYVPVLGWLPLWLVLLGVGDALKVVLVAQAALSPIVFNVHDGVRGVPLPSIELGRVLTFSRWQQLRNVILPSAFPSIWSGIRFGLTKAWLALVAVELLASAQGLGFMMVNARSLYQLDVMFVSVIAIGVVGFVLDRGLQAIEDHVLRWRGPAEIIL